MPFFYVSYISDSFTSLIEYAPKSGFGEWIQQYTCTDPNTIDGSKILYLQSTATNKPNGVRDAALLQMGHSGPWKAQLVLDWYTNKLHTRVETSGTWTNWDRFITASNFTVSNGVLTINLD